MKPLTLAAVLSDFAAPDDAGHQEPAPVADRALNDLPPPGSVEIEPCSPEPEEPEADPFEEGRAAGRAEAEAEFEEERRRLEEKAEEVRRQLEATLGAGMSDRLARALEEKLSRSASEISATLARLLVPLLRRRLEGDSIDAFAQKMSRLITGSAAGQVEIRGPAALLSALQADPRFGSDAIRLVEADQAELTASADRRLLETRLKPLLEELEEICA